ncbi:hypothetical protein C8J57DRAFT_1476891 [Mycena rebaudengoi]|nr:hypothetical protein C8J57DRAFT_1476891 [Mycena rebaudengoi]
MEKLYYAKDRHLPVPILSTVKDYTWASFNMGDFNAIPNEALDFIDIPYRDIPRLTASSGRMLQMDFERGPPRGVSRSDDQLAWLFSEEDIPTVSHSHTITTDEDNNSVDYTYSYSLETEWRDRCATLGSDLSFLISCMVHRHPIYGYDGATQGTGPTPLRVNEGKMKELYDTEEEVITIGASSRQIILSNVAFIAWFQACEPNWARHINAEQVAMVDHMKLRDRPKTGVIFKLERNRHHLNMRFLVGLDVPTYWVWTPEDEQAHKYIRYSPSFLQEYVTASNHGQRAAFVRDLPSYESWKDDLDHYDEFLQNLYTGSPGYAADDVNPEDFFRVVDFLEYGARPVMNKRVIRAYSEKFKSLVTAHREGNRIYTFFRQRPLDESANSDNLEQPRYHKFALERFGFDTSGSHEDEPLAFNESTTVNIRELAKSRWAPNAKHRFSPYNGRSEALDGALAVERARYHPPTSLKPQLAAKDRNDRTPRWIKPPGIVPLAERLSDPYSPSSPFRQRKMGRSPSPPHRRRDSGSLSPPRHPVRGTSRRRSGSLSSDSRSNSSGSEDSHGFENEFQDASSQIQSRAQTPSPYEEREQSPRGSHTQDFPFRTSPDVRADYVPPIKDIGEAIQKVSDWALGAGIIELNPPRAIAEDLAYNWSMDSVEDVLKLALRFGIPFDLFIKQEDAASFPTTLSSMERLSLPAVYVGLPPVAVTATAVDSTATPRQRAVEQRPVAWVREILTGRYGQWHGRNGLLTGPRVENSLFEPFYAQNIIQVNTYTDRQANVKHRESFSTEFN